MNEWNYYLSEGGHIITGRPVIHTNAELNKRVSVLVTRLQNGFQDRKI